MYIAGLGLWCVRLPGVSVGITFGVGVAGVWMSMPGLDYPVWACFGDTERFRELGRRIGGSRVGYVDAV